MTQITSKPTHGERLVSKEGIADSSFQLYLDDIEQRMNSALLGSSITLPIYLVSSLPAQKIGGLIFVSNESGGAVTAFSDGTNWRRTTDRAIVS